ncbi:MAG: tRNA (adenosine(37)-N6)-threonylcarbamoyltransferase complex dimerization subunit type 1 TsaB [Chloroflexota bacterium]
MMAPLLAIDTSTGHATVAVAMSAEPRPGDIHSRRWHARHNHGVELVTAIEETLTEAGLRATDIAAVAVATGPGRFTALRVGLATGQGISLAQGVPMVGVPTPDIEAAPFLPDRARDLYAVTDAGSHGLAWSRYPPGTQAGGAAGEAGVSPLERLVEEAGETAVFCGEAGADLRSVVGDERVLSGDPPTRDPAVFVMLALERLRRGEGGEPESVQPVYARAPSTTTPRQPFPDVSR